VPTPAGQQVPCAWHYPTSLIEVRPLLKDRRLMLRPVLPQDGELLACMINALSEPSRLRRFPNAQLPASADALRGMSCVDFVEHLALVVTVQDQGSECVVADARYRIDERDGSAEFAIVVDDAWQRQGIATWALQGLSRAAIAAGIQRLRCYLPADNAPMLALLGRCQFRCTNDSSDVAIIHAEVQPNAFNAHRASRQEPKRPAGWIQRLLGSTLTP